MSPASGKAGSRRSETSLRSRDPARETLLGTIPAGRASLGWAVAAWVGALVGLGLGALWPAVVPAVAALWLVGRQRSVGILLGVLAAGMASGAGAEMRSVGMLTVPVVPGELRLEAVVASDPQPVDDGYRLVVSTRGGDVAVGVVLLVEALDPGAVQAGDTVGVEGRIVDRPGRWGRSRYRARLVDAEVELIGEASGPFFRPGNWLRGRVLDGLGDARSSPQGALLAGFLVGDTSQLPSEVIEDLRRTGLSHFVAVSGRNVALFLAAWWLLVGPFGLNSRLRAATALAALSAFVVATRWQPSVVRASTMASVMLGGRLVGIPVDSWRALGTAVTVCLVVAGDLAVDVGFQLSVAATLGVMLGVRWVPDRRPRWVWTVLWVSGGAQLGVLPIVLWTWGTVPLLSPLVNLVASPLVAVATSFGAIGALTGIAPLRQAGLLAADAVLTITRHASPWPQVGALGAAATLAMLIAFRRQGLRPAVILASVTLVGVASLPASPPSVPTVTFLDVGQGDAIVLRDPSGATALFDGGRDPAVLHQALRRVGVNSLDLVMVSHGDADHAAGLERLAGTFPVGELWYPRHQEENELIAPLTADAANRGIPVRAVGDGERARLGELELLLLGPRRRYATDNDGSIVVWVEAGEATALLTGDIEAVPQRELPELRPHVLQVPHHGSATTDPRWLAATLGEIAVVSVGPNPYGHPSPDTMEVLDRSGARVHTTLEEGDVVVQLCLATCGG